MGTKSSPRISIHAMPPRKWIGSVQVNHLKACLLQRHANHQPVPADTFSATGTLNIPEEFIGQIPSIAFTVPDVDADATLKLKSADSDEELGCIKSGVTNGRSLDVPAVSYIAVGIAGAALLLTGLSTLGSAGTAGNHAPSLGFTTVLGWFQSMAMNGMHSVNYPPVYRSFAKNFAFSGGLISWDSMQVSIDSFRNSTGGNLTEDSVPYLRNATLAFNDGSSNTTTFMRRDLAWMPSEILKRQISAGTGDNDTNAADDSQNSATHITHGIAGYVEQLTIPQANTFMTVLLVFAIVIAAITVGILLFKVILETWALFGSFPKRLTSFRQRYWMTLAKTITNLILLLYGVWTLYCIYQFTNGDSWAAKLLAGITLATFTAILGYFTYKIWSMVRKLKKAEGDASGLYEDKETWIKYSIFYDSYKRGYWWLFMPVIVYMFAKGCVLAAGNGHGLVQTSGQLIIESLMFIFLLWNRPYATVAGNWINIVIQVVRVLSVICILVFVEQLGIAQTTKTITGVILIGVQAGLTGILAILIAINAIIICCKENPHRKKRKEAGKSSHLTIDVFASDTGTEKLNREFDNLTPLDARNSLLIGSIDQKGSGAGYAMGPYKGGSAYTPVANPGSYHGRSDSSEGLMVSAAGMARGHSHSRSTSREHEPFDAIPLAARQPTLPNVGSQRGFNERQVV